jgi:hypothetical protein
MRALEKADTANGMETMENFLVFQAANNVTGSDSPKQANSSCLSKECAIDTITHVQVPAGASRKNVVWTIFGFPLNRSFVEMDTRHRPAHTLEDYGLTIAVRLIPPTVEIRTATYVEPVTLLLVYLSYY